MTHIPRSALLLGLAGLLPFLLGMVTMLRPEGFGFWVQQNFGGRFVGPYLQLAYGAIILSFMSGVLWGFATKAEGQLAAMGYGLSVIPALWAFFMVGGGPTAAAVNLIFGFLGLLVLDWYFWRLGLAPKWWMHLRILLTAGVIITLLPIVF
ncbi:DUF3429 domain-containing protein [Yoonia sp. 208BN28-4]|uniref:DUF3429 domain-containing protein n=1 Tax=Yoonia sp. 208BN28-4 TaxID=3126505 RepID=UPI0030AF4E74